MFFFDMFFEKESCFIVGEEITLIDDIVEFYFYLANWIFSFSSNCYSNLGLTGMQDFFISLSRSYVALCFYNFGEPKGFED